MLSSGGEGRFRVTVRSMEPDCYSMRTRCHISPSHVEVEHTAECELLYGQPPALIRLYTARAYAADCISGVADVITWQDNDEFLLSFALLASCLAVVPPTLLLDHPPRGNWPGCSSAPCRSEWFMYQNNFMQFMPHRSILSRYCWNNL